MKKRDDINPDDCLHPDTALAYNAGHWAPGRGAIPGQPGMYCRACRICVTPVTDIQDFITLRKTKWMSENNMGIVPVFDPFGVPVLIGSTVCFPQPKRKLAWGTVEEINHGKLPTPGEIAKLPRVTAPMKLKIRPTDDDNHWNLYSWDIRNDGKRKSYGLGVHVAPWAVVL